MATCPHKGLDDTRPTTGRYEGNPLGNQAGRPALVPDPDHRRGTVVAIINTVERLNGGSDQVPGDPLLYQIATDIVTGYIAAGLTTWAVLYVKEVIVTLADVIRRKAQEREDRRVREAEERALGARFGTRYGKG